MEITGSLIAYIPYSPPLRIFGDEPLDLYDCILNIREDLSKTVENTYGKLNNITLKNLSESDTVDAIFAQYKDIKFSNEKNNKYIQIYCVIEANINADLTHEPFESYDKISTINMLLHLDFKQFTKNVLITSQLSYPARLHTRQGLITSLTSGVIDVIPPIGNYTIDMLAPFTNLNWVKISTLNFKEVWDWLNHINFFNTDIPQTPIHRAISAFTHITSPEVQPGSIIQLFWAMVGLEAIYCQGRGDLRKQLSEKTQLYLGNLTEFKSIVGKLYDYRSLFVHGDLPFPSYFGEELDSKDYQSHIHESFRYSSIACGILIATIQKLASENRTTLDFDCIIKN